MTDAQRAGAPVLVTGSVRAAPGRTDELRDAIRAITTESRRDPGCLAYVFGPDLDDPMLFVSTEVWARRSDLDAHMTHAHTAHLLEIVPDLIDGEPELTVIPLD